MLENIKSPEDLKKVNKSKLPELAKEIREKIIDTVSKNGGHLASNLGLVEMTLVLHRLFDAPTDTFIFDVGHQCYAHKLLTGRFDSFDSLRTGDGISGFTNRFESKYDTLTAGHSGSSISSALGIATANKLQKSDAYTVAIVGDGSFTNGMIYEALNNCNDRDVKLIIILNDNEMSISQNVGSLARYLSKIRTSGRYYSFKRNFQKVFGKIPVIGKATISFFRHLKNGLKRLFYKQPFFEALGVRYIGPVDGNDLDKLEVVLKEAKKVGSCTLVHMKTKKGYGYGFAQEHPENYHSVGAFDSNTGVVKTKANDFSSVFGDIVLQKASNDESICAITAAMCDGTGLTDFAEKYPERFFDVGIAEEHEIAFAAGLNVKGYNPVCALYSTFAQRVFDQLIHDVSLQKLHIVLALDRAGLVPGDGQTHQGIFDCSFISEIPGTEIYSPDSYSEMKDSFDKAISSDIISVVRYPKGKEAEYDRSGFVSYGDYKVCKNSDTVYVITYGGITKNVYKACEMLKECGINATIIKLLKVHPVKDFSDKLCEVLCDATHIFFVEEGIKNGGVSEKLVCELAQNPKITAKMKFKAIDGFYPVHGSKDYVEKYCGLDADSIASDIKEFLE